MQKSSKFAVALLVLASVVSPVFALSTLLGNAYDLSSDELLYREVHQFRYEQDILVGDEVKYLRPDGSLLGRKSLDFRPSLYLPAFTTELYDGRYVEGLRYVEGQIEVFKRLGKDAQEQSRIIDRRDAMAADAGFNNYVHRRFDDLVQGEKVAFHFIAASRLAAVKLKARRVADRNLGGQTLIEFKVSLSSILSLFFDPLRLSYDALTRQLVEYRGLSNVRDEQGEPYQVRIAYPQFITMPAAAQ